jgi:hypothetical protein
MGHEDEAKTVLAAKERSRRAVELRKLPRWRKPTFWAFTRLLEMVGYGYRPALALIPALTVVYVGAAAVKRGWEVGVLERAETAAAVQPDVPAPPEVALVPLAYSLEAFVPIVELGQVEAFRPDMAKRWGWWLQVYMWGHGFLGWLIGGIAVAGILGLFRRE